MARPRFVTFAAEADGDVLANKVVTLQNSDGAQFSGTVYDAASGGAVITSFSTNSVGVVELYTDDTNAKYIKYAVAGVAGTRNGSFDPDPGQVVQRTTVETLTNKTLTSPTITTPTITSPSISNPTMTGTGTFVNMNGTGLFSAKGLNSASSKGGINVASNGGVYIGTSAYNQAEDSPFATMIANRTGAIEGSEALLAADMFVRAAYTVAGTPASGATDNAGITLTTSEGDLANRPANYEGPAGNIIGIENRFITATYATKIAAGHHGTRLGLGVGIGTQTQPTPAADGLDARDEIGIIVDCDGRASFPELTWQGNPNPNYLNGVRTGIALNIGGFTGSWFPFMIQKEGYGNHGDPRDPAAFVNYLGQHSIWGTPATIAGMLHVVRNTAALGANVPILIVQGDNTGTVANQLRIQGQTATTKRLTAGYDTTSNWGTVDADSAGTGSPLLVNPTGGSVYLASSSAAAVIGGAIGRLVVKQIADDVNSGFCVARAGATPKRYLSAWIDGSGANLTSVSPGTSNRVLTLGAEATDVGLIFNTDATANTVDLVQIKNNSSTMVSISRYGHLNATVQGVSTFTKAGAPSDADFSTAPPVGTLVVDTTGGATKIYAKTAAATWKSVAIA